MKDKIKSHFKENYLPFFEKYLSGIKRLTGDEYRSICCFHDEKNPSFDFSIKNGRFFCHGCHEKGDIFSFFAKRNGLSVKSDFQKILKGIASDFGIQNGTAGTKIVKGIKRNKIIAEYVYADSAGKPRHKVSRTEDKNFYQSSYINDRWVKGIKGIELSLYNLLAVIKADEVITVEGENDVDTLKTLGFVATTNAMGAGCWKDSYNKHLKDKNIVLIPDNDDEGRKHMHHVAQSLNGKVKSLKWLKLPGLQVKGDVSDFIAKFDDKDEAAESLAVLIDNAEPYKTKSPPKFEDAILTTQKFKKLDLPKRANFLSPWLKEKSISLISGWRGVGKTFFVLGVLDAITRNSNFGQWECETPVNCLYVDGEMTSEDMDERIDHLELNSDREKKLHIYSVAYASRLGLPRASLTDETWRDNLKAFMLDNNIRLWVADNIGSLAGGLDENVKKDWDVINQWLLELRFAGIATALLHHVGKSGEQRGTSAREDNIDISITLKAPHDHTPEDGARFNVHFTKSRVATKHLPLIADTEFKIIEDKENHIWVHGNVKQERKKEVLKMLNDGLEQKTIAESLCISKGYVSQIKNEAVKEGLLSQKKQLTQSGIVYLGT